MSKPTSAPTHQCDKTAPRAGAQEVSGRGHAWQAQDPGFKAQHHKQTK